MRRWDEVEVCYLKKNWGYKTIKFIAEKLKRTEMAVIIKANRLKLGSYYTAGESLNANQVAELLKVDIHAITDYWVPRYGLKCKKVTIRKRQSWSIKFDDLMKWLELNQDKWDSRRVEYMALGCEPKWLKDKRIEDMKLPKRKCQKWTREEDIKAISLFKIGHEYKDIAIQLNRSKEGVIKRLNKLDIWGNGEFIKS